MSEHARAAEAAARVTETYPTAVALMTALQQGTAELPPASTGLTFPAEQAFSFEGWDVGLHQEGDRVVMTRERAMPSGPSTPETRFGTSATMLQGVDPDGNEIVWAGTWMQHKLGDHDAGPTKQLGPKDKLGLEQFLQAAYALGTKRAERPQGQESQPAAPRRTAAQAVLGLLRVHKP
ncbi:MAG TPA: hypothetical protein VLF91_04915 [Candidatus Saccharimonadales bacterium]|nr:hypothetical protein [Candidatus Saccharimonadales bacterium]